MRRALWAVALLWACDDGGSAAPKPVGVLDAARPPAPRADGGQPGRMDAGAPRVDAALPRADAAPLDAGRPAADAMTADDAGPRRDAAPLTDGGPPPPDAAPTPDGGPPDDAPWPLRGCTVTLRYTGAGAAVQVAGEFTGWADAPRAMERGADGFTLTLGPADGLEPGARYAYKLIVDGAWQLDPRNTHRKYDGDCVNSGLQVPACDAGPAIVAAPLEVDGDAMTARVQVQRARDAALPTRVEFTLDGDPLPAPAVEAGGWYTVSVDGLATGKHRLSVRVTDDAGRDAEPVDLPFWIEDTPFDWRAGALYLLFIDRFANGDRDADRPVGDPVEYTADWHGGDLWGGVEVIESGYFERLGVKTIWLSPVNLQVDGHFAERGDGPRRIAAYHGYWPIDGRQVDPRFGGDAALHAFVQAAHARGIRVLLDLINNQIHEQHAYYDSHPEWFRTGCVCGLDPGCGWSERPLDCLFARYLPDINWRVAGAEQRFIADALYWIDTFDVDGFRVDAVKHVETTSIYNLRAAMAQRYEQGGHRIVMLGETAVGENDSFADGCGVVYGDGYDWVSAYVGDNALDGQFDFPSHHRMQHGLLTGSLSMRALEETVARLEQRYAPDALHVQFLGSHDSSRMATRAASDPAEGCRFQDDGGCASLPATPVDPAVFQRLRRAWTFLLTLPGVPLIYNGDEVGLAGGNDPDSRRDMRWEGALSDLAMDPSGLSAEQRGLRAWIEAVATARGAHPALWRGARRELWVDDDVYVQARWTDDDAALVVLNRGAEVTVPVPLGPLAERFGAFEVALGDLQARREGATLMLTVPAGESGIVGETE